MDTRYPTFDPSDVVVLGGDLLNQICRDLERLSRLSFSRDFQVSDNKSGMTVSVNLPPGARTLKITTSTSLAGGVYNVQVGQGSPYIDPAVDSAIPQTNETFSANNTAYLENTPEVNHANSHWLPNGAFILAYPSGSTSTDHKPIYRIYLNGPTVDFQIIDYDADAQYTLKTLSGASTASSGSAFTAPAGMAEAGSVDALGCNLDESALPGNRLEKNKWGQGNVVGATAAGLRIVYFHGGCGRTTNLITLSRGTYGSPDATTWQRDVDGKGVIWEAFWFGFDAGSGNIFMMTRKPTYDARGMLWKVSAETQANLGTNPCP